MKKISVAYNEIFKRELFDEFDVKYNKKLIDESIFFSCFYSENNNSHLENLKFLIEKKANVDLEDKFGKSPLHYLRTQKEGNEKCEALFQKDIDIEKEIEEFEKKENFNEFEMKECLSKIIYHKNLMNMKNITLKLRILKTVCAILKFFSMNRITYKLDKEIVEFCLSSLYSKDEENLFESIFEIFEIYEIALKKILSTKEFFEKYSLSILQVEQLRLQEDLIKIKKLAGCNLDLEKIFKPEKKKEIKYPIPSFFKFFPMEKIEEFSEHGEKILAFFLVDSDASLNLFTKLCMTKNKATNCLMENNGAILSLLTAKISDYSNQNYLGYRNLLNIFLDLLRNNQAFSFQQPHFVPFRQTVRAETNKEKELFQLKEELYEKEKSIDSYSQHLRHLETEVNEAKKREKENDLLFENFEKELQERRKEVERLKKENESFSERLKESNNLIEKLKHLSQKKEEKVNVVEESKNKSNTLQISSQNQLENKISLLLEEKGETWEIGKEEAKQFVTLLDQDWRTFSERSSRQSKVICGALKEFSSGLFSCSTQFIEEIIQNISDSYYHENQQKQMFFHLNYHSQKPYILISSNEKGFRIKDVNSICSFTTSTKQSGNMIGHKGILNIFLKRILLI